MNFNELQKLVTKIKKTIPCRECNENFKEKDLNLLGFLMNETYFHAHCAHCGNTTYITGMLTINDRTHQGLDTPSHVIENNDVLDMHNFLKKFDGDFISLFKK